MRNLNTWLKQVGRATCARTYNLRACLLLTLSLCLLTLAHAQSGAVKKQAVAPPPAPTQPALTRTTTRTEKRRFPFGNTLIITGAPVGSISVEAWPRSEVEITADIELHADTEEDLARLASVNNFVLDEDSTRYIPGGHMVEDFRGVGHIPLRRAEDILHVAFVHVFERGCRRKQ